MKKLKGLWAGALMFILVCMLAGCGLKSSAPATGASSAGNSSYAVTDIQGTRVELPEKPQRILTLSMSTDEVVLGLVPPDHLVAVNALLDDPVSSNITELAQQVPQRIKNPSVEEIAALQPDLVIMPDWGDVSRAQQLRDLGIKVVVCYGAKNLAQIKDTVTLIADAVGEPERGRDLLQQMDEELAWVDERVRRIPPDQRQSVVLISLMSTYGGAGCSFDEACQLAGVTNGMAAAGIQTGQAMTKEQLVQINPDVLFLPTYNNHGQYDIDKFRARYLDDPSLHSMKAIREKRIAEPFDGYIYNCSQDFVFGVQEIAYRVYGDEFAQPTDRHLTAVPAGE